MRPIRPSRALLLLAVVASAPHGACAAARPADLVMREGIVHHREGRLTAAASRYQEALRLSPAREGAYNNLALVALARDELTRAVALLEEELQRHPGSAHARLNRALVLLRLGDYARAEVEVAPLAAVGGGLPEALPERLDRQRRARVILAAARWGAEAPADAIVAPLELALAGPATPNDAALTAARRALARVRAAAGDIDVALSVAEPLEAPDDVLLRAALLARSGRPEEAVALLEVAPEAAAQPYGLLLRADALLALGRDGDAREALGRWSPPADSPLAEWHARLTATLASRGGDWEAALAALETAPAGSQDLWLDRAVALAHLGRIDEARLAVAGVLRDAPGNARALALRALLE